MHRTDADGHVGNQFSDGSPGTDGTQVDATFMNMVQEELMTLLTEAGISPYATGASDAFDQLLPAIQTLIRDQAIYDTAGIATAFTVTTTPAITAYADGQTFRIRPHVANTGACSLDVDGVGAIVIHDDDAGSMVAGQLQNDNVYTVVYNSTLGTFELQNQISEVTDARGTAANLAARLANVITSSGAFDTSCSKAIPAAWISLFSGSAYTGYGFDTIWGSGATPGRWYFDFSSNFNDTGYCPFFEFIATYDYKWKAHVMAKTTSQMTVDFYFDGVRQTPTFETVILVMGDQT